MPNRSALLRVRVGYKEGESTCTTEGVCFRRRIFAMLLLIPGSGSRGVGLWPGLSLFLLVGGGPTRRLRQSPGRGGQSDVGTLGPKWLAGRYERTAGAR